MYLAVSNSCGAAGWAIQTAPAINIQAGIIQRQRIKLAILEVHTVTSKKRLWVSIRN
jgi:hypothetical protein